MGEFRSLSSNVMLDIKVMLNRILYQELDEIIVSCPDLTTRKFNIFFLV